MRFGKCLVALVALVVLWPASAYAQASLAGVVKDTSNAVLPGVTVEASSPVLIEKTRTAVTDGTGQYQITNLRPGTYTLTFTLTGFNTVKREGVEVTGTGTFSINADMKVGTIEETVTVVGETPVVDIQSSRQQAVLSSDVIRDLPTSRQYYSIATLVPGMTVTNQSQDVGGSATLGTPDYQIHGGLPGDGRLTVDGLSVGSARSSGANRSMYVVNVGLAQETSIVTSGGLGEAETAGVAINVVPREGGNTFHGSWFVGYSSGALQGSNYADVPGLSAPNSLQKVWEVTPIIGGPVFKDKLWFLFSARTQGTRNTIAGMYYNLNAGDPTKFTYSPNLDHQAVDDGTWKSASMRLTWQANRKNKISGFWDEQDRKVGWVGGGNATTSPEAAGLSFGHPDRVGQVSWTSPISSRVLLEVAAGLHQLQWNAKERPGYDDTFGKLVRITDQGGNGFVPGITYRGQVWASDWSGTYPIRASVSYVTGANSLKVGMLRTWYTTNDNNFDPNAMNYTFNNGTPTRLQLVNKPQNIREQHTTYGIYAQDSWTLKRLTLQGGIRYDRMTQVFPEQVVGFTPFVPNGFTIPKSDGVNWNDITPRFSAAYDLTGDGKTAIKGSVGKYMLAQDGGATFGSNLNPQLRMAVGTVNRSWNDTTFFPPGDPRRGNFVPDCNMLNNAANGECGAVSDPNWGTNTIETNYSDSLIHGWGARPYQWEFTASVQRQLIPRVAVNVGYFRRTYGNAVVTDNLAVGPADFDQFTVPVPADPTLPGGGGGSLPFLNVKPALFGVTNNLVTSATNYGNLTQHWNGFDVNVNVRAAKGLTFSGGTSTGRASLDACDLVNKLPEAFQGGLASALPSVPTSFIGSSTAQYSLSHCDVTEPWITQFKAVGSYLLPKFDVLVAATFQSAPGPELASTYNVPNSVVFPSLQRLISGTTTLTQTTPVNIVAPGALYGDRTNQLDLRFAKVLRYGRTRTNVGIDLYNALNANPVTAFNQTYVTGKYLAPQAIMPARFLKFSAQFDW